MYIVYGIQGWGTYVPYRRLDRSQIASVTGTHGGSGTRAVASYDEDTTTMGVEAARLALRRTGDAPAAVWFATAAPAYLDKTNATAIHAALRLDRTWPPSTRLGSVRSAVGALVSRAVGEHGPTLVVVADVRDGLPDSDRRDRRRRRGRCGPGRATTPSAPVLAEVSGRRVGDRGVPRPVAHSRTTARSQLWEERFGETRYVPLARQA